MSLMTVSSASAETCTISRYSRCSGVSVGVERQLGHADDAVHRRADLVAHVGQEFALGPAGRLAASRSPASVFSCLRITSVCWRTRPRRMKTHANAVSTTSSIAPRSQSTRVSDQIDGLSSTETSVALRRRRRRFVTETRPSWTGPSACATATPTTRTRLPGRRLARPSAAGVAARTRVHCASRGLERHD